MIARPHRLDIHTAYFTACGTVTRPFTCVIVLGLLMLDCLLLVGWGGFDAVRQLVSKVDSG